MPSVRDLYRKQQTLGASLEPLALPHIATPSDPGAGNTAIYAKSDGKIYRRAAGGSEVEVGSGGGHTIEDEGVPLTQRSNLNFAGSGVTVTDDSENDRTVVTIGSTGSSISTIDIYRYTGGV